jgi:hypothetical protein
MKPEILNTLLLSMSTIAAVGSCISAYLNWRVALAAKEFNNYATNVVTAGKGEELIGRHPQLLDLHGFSHQNLQKLDLSQEEVAYLITSFSAGDLFYRGGNHTELTKYRQILLQSARVQTAWKAILKGKFILDGQFSILVDRFIASNPPTRP